MPFLSVRNLIFLALLPLLAPHSTAYARKAERQQIFSHASSEFRGWNPSAWAVGKPWRVINLLPKTWGALV